MEKWWLHAEVRPTDSGLSSVLSCLPSRDAPPAELRDEIPQERMRAGA